LENPGSVEHGQNKLEETNLGKTCDKLFSTTGLSIEVCQTDLAYNYHFNTMQLYFISILPTVIAGWSSSQ